MPVILTILELLGGLGVFLYGMKVMSEALQKVAGERMRSVLSTLTRNRFSAILTGLGVTCVVQSSSATTVLVVGFVTAGLLTLKQAIGVIMGANIGTTLTGWLVALLGFKVKITAFALPAVGIGFAMGFLRGARVRQWGEALLGFGLLFIGLALLKDSVPELGSAEDLEWVTRLGGHGFLSTVMFVLVGTLLTVVLQSSSATMTLTLTLAAMGWLPYELAAAMVLGENIGTTITANLAAIGAPKDAVRAARVHLIFNIVGVGWALALMNVALLPAVDALVPGDPNASIGTGDAGPITTHLAAFHSLFNITNMLLMVGFVDPLAKLVVRWVPDGDDGKGHGFGLRHLPGSTNIVETPELTLVLAGRELEHMTQITSEMLRDAITVLSRPEEDLGGLVKKTLQSEEDIDELEREIIQALSFCARAATSAQASRKIAELIHNTHRVERIADHVATLIRITRRVRDSGQRFTAEELEKLSSFGALVGKSIDYTGVYLRGEGTAAEAEALEDEIDRQRGFLRAETIDRIQSGGGGLREGLAFLDALTHLEEIGDRAVGIIRRAEFTAQL
ncbi:MAG: Na/Pi cotransporter family protein [Proteobacteria bacterium]|nr:Na/Pi cotransporter family protein [Pseudomonadota bacterium]MCP4921651.1 Na/Pi cotransporter family protein [Pseudomonadota bacterium]